MKNSIKKQRKEKRVRQQNQAKVQIVRFRATLLPDEMEMEFSYVAEDVKISASALYAVAEYRANGVFDHQVSLGGGTAAGFAEWSNFYNVYRPLRSRIEWSVTNNEAFPVTVGAIYTNTRVGTALGAWSDAMSVLENPYSTRRYTLAAKGGIDTKNIQYRVSLPNVLGNPANYYGNDAFGAVFTANPSAVIYLTCIATSSGASNLTNGVIQTLTIHTTCLLYNRRLLF